MIAYFSMEIGLAPNLPTYSGGLGVLAGDTVRAAADLGVPMAAVSLVHRHGYFRQRLAADGTQTEEPAPWQPETRCEALPARVQVQIEGRPVTLRAWRYPVRGLRGHEIPVYLLDADLPENAAQDRTITHHLYGGDGRTRLCQEIVLGMGGLAMLRALGHVDVEAFHMNEGHSALLALGLLEEDGDGLAGVERVRRQCVFTTHTPVPAGHDRFPLELVHRLLGERRVRVVTDLGCCLDGHLNMTHLALFFSRFVNGVAMRHGQVSRGMFPNHAVAAITNGVHAGTWVAPAFRALFDRHVPEWREQNANLRHAVGIPLAEIDAAHRQAKAVMVQEVAQRTGVALDPRAFTLGFARRATSYKRADLLLSDRERLRRLAALGPVQIVYGGKAHPNDGGGKELIQRVFAAARALAGVLPVVYLEEYDMAVAQWLCAGVDLWVNTPKPPLEASGTSGMKSALNGVPSLSVLDGWWIEGHVEGVTGWAIGQGWEVEDDPARERQALYDQLERIARLFHEHPLDYVRVMRQAIALNGAFFNAQRMVQQYVGSAYGSIRRTAT